MRMFSRRQLPLIFLANFQDVSKILKKKTKGKGASQEKKIRTKRSWWTQLSSRCVRMVSKRKRNVEEEKMSRIRKFVTYNVGIQ